MYAGGADHPPPLSTFPTDENVRDDETGDGIPHQHVEFGEQKEVQYPVDEEQCRPDGVSTWPRFPSRRRRPLLDRKPYTEHDGQKTEELALGALLQNSFDQTPPTVTFPDRIEISDEPGSAGEDPDVGAERACNRDAAQYIQ